jgi:hypothetical protein
MDNIDKLLNYINSFSNPRLILDTLSAIAEPVINHRDNVHEELQVGIRDRGTAALNDVKFLQNFK